MYIPGPLPPHHQHLALPSSPFFNSQNTLSNLITHVLSQLEAAQNAPTSPFLQPFAPQLASTFATPTHSPTTSTCIIQFLSVLSGIAFTLSSLYVLIYHFLPSRLQSSRAQRRERSPFFDHENERGLLSDMDEAEQLGEQRRRSGESAQTMRITQWVLPPRPDLTAGIPEEASPCVGRPISESRVKRIGAKSLSRERRLLPEKEERAEEIARRERMEDARLRQRERSSVREGGSRWYPSSER